MSAQEELALTASPPTVKPDVALVDDLFEEIDSGRIRIPRFQRPFVWKPRNMLALFDSIHRGYPIGNLLFWQTDIPVETTGEIGPITFGSNTKQTPALILDGQQRLSTLYGALRIQDKMAHPQEQSSWQWRVFYDLRNKEFIHIPSQKPEPHHLPVRAVLKTVDFLTYSRSLVAQTPRDADALIAEAERVVQRIKSYKFAITRIQGGTMAEAVEIFSRLNTTGRPMTPDEMVSALTYKEGQSKFHLASRIDRILDRIAPLGFAGFSRTFLFRSIVAATGRSMLNADWARVSREFSAGAAQSVDEVESSIVMAIDFLRESFGVTSDRMLPYSYQLVMLAEFFRGQTNPDEEKHQLLRQWFWRTSCSGWFAGANSTQIEDMTSNLRALARDVKGAQSAELLPELKSRGFPRNFDLRSARVRSLFLALWHRNKPIHLDGTPVHTGDALAARGARAFAQLFTDGSPQLTSSPANRVFLPLVETKDALTALANGAASPAFLKAHSFPQGSSRFLQLGRSDDFLKERLRRMRSDEREVLGRLGVALPQEDSEGDVDTGEP